ncbi:hypothetical protein EMMF5_004629 [Cystobasidiomycetes sp. EMM_F5]
MKRQADGATQRTARLEPRPYGPSFSADVYHRPPTQGRIRPSQKQTLYDSDDRETAKDVMDSFWRDRREYTESYDSDTDVQASQGPAIPWAKLLDAAAAQSYKPPIDDNLDVMGMQDTDALSQVAVEEPTSFETQLSAERDLVEQREAEALGDVDQLREEVKELSSVKEILEWMGDRIFSLTNPESLINKIDQVEDVPSPKLVKLYPYLLAEIIDMLRPISPHAALIPLRQASKHSAKSYLYGCDTAVYNATMKVYWEQWGDVEGCLSLLEEMERGGVSIGSSIATLTTQISDALAADVLNARQAAQAGLDRDSDDANEGPRTHSHKLEHPSAGDRSARQRSHESELEYLAESKMFFDRLQRRAGHKIDRLITAQRQRAAEYLQKANVVSDMYRESDNKGDPRSHVNQLIDAYGSMPRPSRNASFAGRYAPVEGGAVQSRNAPQDSLLPAALPSDEANIVREDTEALQSSPMEEVPDILAMAINEVAAAPPPVRRRARRRNSKKAATAPK